MCITVSCDVALSLPECDCFIVFLPSSCRVSKCFGFYRVLDHFWHINKVVVVVVIIIIIIIIIIAGKTYICYHPKKHAQGANVAYAANFRGKKNLTSTKMNKKH